jgi:hypothetical protein
LSAVPWDLAIPLAAAGSGAAWAHAAAVRAGGVDGGSTALALLAGVAAAGLALVGYDAAAALGVRLAWEAVAAGGAGGIASAAAIGLVEEGAKLAGLLLVAPRGASRSAALAACAGVAAGFAGVEAVVTLAGDTSAAALARVALGPVAHALLAVPLAAGVAASGPTRWRRLALPAALAASAALHAAGDLGLALSGFGRAAYAAALAAPALALFASARGARK